MEKKSILGKKMNFFLIIKKRLNLKNNAKKKIKLTITPKDTRNLNSISHEKLVEGFKTGEIFKNKKILIRKHRISLEYLYKHDKKD